MSITPAQAALAVSGAALIWTIARWRRGMIAKAKRPAEAPARTGGAGGGQGMGGTVLSVRELTTEITALLADLEETSRRVAAQIENRQRRLDALIVEADEKIRRLEGLMAEDGGGKVADKGAAGAGGGGPVVVARDAAAMLSRLRQERGAPQAALDPAYQPIYALADQGKNSREIAQALGRQPGEIELILALRGRRQGV